MRSQLRSFEGQTAVITGGGTGVGAAVALALADAGTNIILIGRRMNRLERVAATVRNMGTHAACYSADISSGSSLLEVAQFIKTELMRTLTSSFKMPPCSLPALSRTLTYQTLTNCIKQMCALPTH